MQEEFSHTVLHRNKAVGSQPVKTRAGAANTQGAAGLTIQNLKFLGRQLPSNLTSSGKHASIFFPSDLGSVSIFCLFYS